MQPNPFAMQMGGGMMPMGGGYPGYGPQGFGQNPGAESTALVLFSGAQFGGMGGGMQPNPFMAGPPRAPSSAGTNPFRVSQSGGQAPANPIFEAKKMANDPLNHITTDLFQSAKYVHHPLHGPGAGCCPMNATSPCCCCCCCCCCCILR